MRAKSQMPQTGQFQLECWWTSLGFHFNPHKEVAWSDPVLRLFAVGAPSPPTKRVTLKRSAFFPVLCFCLVYFTFPAERKSVLRFYHVSLTCRVDTCVRSTAVSSVLPGGPKPCRCLSKQMQQGIYSECHCNLILAVVQPQVLKVGTF